MSWVHQTEWVVGVGAGFSSAMMPPEADAAAKVQVTDVELAVTGILTIAPLPPSMVVLPARLQFVVHGLLTAVTFCCDASSAMM